MSSFKYYIKHIYESTRVSEADKIKTIKKYPGTIKLYNNPSIPMQKAAIIASNGNSDVLISILNRTREVEELAVFKNPKNINFIKFFPSEKMLTYVLKSRIVGNFYYKYINEESSEKLKLLALKNSFMFIYQIGKVNTEMIITALKSLEEEGHVNFLDMGKDMTSTLNTSSLKDLIDYNTNMIKFIKNPNVEIQLYAVKKNIKSFQYIDKPSVKTQRFIGQKDISMISQYPEKFKELLNSKKTKGPKFKYLKAPADLGIFADDN